MPGNCTRCNREVRFAEEKLAFGKSWHTFCFSCRACRKLLSGNSVATFCGDLYCKECYSNLSSSSAPHFKDQSQEYSEYSDSDFVQPVNSCKIEFCKESKENSKNREYYEKLRLRGGGGENEVECYYAGKEKQCFESCKDYKDAQPCDNPLCVKQNSFTIRNVNAAKSGHYSVPGSFNGLGCKFASLNNRHPHERSPQCMKATCYGSQIKEAQLNADTGLRYAKDSKEIITRYSTCKSSSKNTIIPSRRKIPHPTPRSPVPSRRRVSFSDVIQGDKCIDESATGIKAMQDSHNKFCCKNESFSNESYSHSCDVWRADESTSKDDDEYDSAPDTNPLNPCEDSVRVHYTNSNTNCSDIAVKHSTEVANCEVTKEECDGSKIIKETGSNCKRENCIITSVPSNESISSHTFKDVCNKEEFKEDERMRGGCCGPCCLHCSRPRSSRSTSHKVIDFSCPANNNCMTCCRRIKTCPAQEQEKCRPNITCCACSSCCSERPQCPPVACEKPICKNSLPPCRSRRISKSCGQGGSCGGGCRGGCGKPGQTCLPLISCSTPPCRPRSSAGNSMCSPTQTCTMPQVCCCSRKPVSNTCPRRICPSTEKCGCGSGPSCCRARSPGCRTKSSRESCNNDGTKVCTDRVSCCRPRFSGCECFGGGLDCQRCGRKVYQAEMQMVSGVPYHNTCFSCFCCRKPLEPLTYQENCGEIYCKQCYVRNFGPQGYGYGVGAGALQTPL